MKKLGWICLALVLTPEMGGAAVKTETITYKVGDTTFKGYLAYDDATKDKRPGILVVHEFWGLDAYARKRAEQLAGLGYVAFAVDMYGDGKTTEHPKEAGKMAGMVRANEKEWLARGKAGLKILRNHPHVDGQKLAAIGYCFGGSTALKLAHAGTDLAAVVSFHGALPIPSAEEVKGIKAKILICHGAADSFIKEDTIQQVRGAYEKGGVDYEMIYFGGARHSFTVPDANSKNIDGIRYDPAADRRSWAAMRSLFHEAFEKTGNDEAKEAPSEGGGFPCWQRSFCFPGINLTSCRARVQNRPSRNATTDPPECRCYPTPDKQDEMISFSRYCWMVGGVRRATQTALHTPSGKAMMGLNVRCISQNWLCPWKKSRSAAAPSAVARMTVPRKPTAKAFHAFALEIARNPASSAFVLLGRRRRQIPISDPRIHPVAYHGFARFRTMSTTLEPSPDANSLGRSLPNTLAQIRRVSPLSS